MSDINNFQITYFFNQIDKIDVLLQNESEDQWGDNYPELIPDIQIQLDENNEINLNNIITQLKNFGFDLNDCLISYWSPSTEAYIICGADPIPKNITLIREDFINYKYVFKL